MKNYQKLLNAVFNPVDKSPNLGSRRLILKEWETGKKKFAIYHKDTGKYLDKDGKEYKQSELY